MAARTSFLHSLLASFVLVALASLTALAQVEVAPEVENSKVSFIGIVNNNSVYVRSGPGDSYYPTMTLTKGQELTIVGIRFDWLKIVPPEGSFCYVAKAFVEKRSDGTVGRVTKDDVNVRAGSNLNDLKMIVVSKVARDSDVQILGEQDEYFKIKPPATAYLYVNKKFVDPVRSAAAAPAPGTPTGAGAQAPGGAAAPGNLADPFASPTTKPAEIAAAQPAPATQPTVETSEQDFDRLETVFKDADQKPLADQPVAELLAGYQKIAAADTLPESMRRVVDWRIKILTTRVDASQKLAEVQKQRQESQQKLQALVAERQEIEERIAQGVAIYTAVGNFQASSLQFGPTTLYRLTDPASSRTVCYIRSSDSKILGHLGHFVGVKGDISGEPQLAPLKVITVTDIAVVDPAKVNNGVSAQLVPPSLLTQRTSPQASTDNK